MNTTKLKRNNYRVYVCGTVGGYWVNGRSSWPEIAIHNFVGIRAGCTADTCMRGVHPPVLQNLIALLHSIQKNVSKLCVAIRSIAHTCAHATHFHTRTKERRYAVYWLMWKLSRTLNQYVDFCFLAFWMPAKLIIYMRIGKKIVWLIVQRIFFCRHFSFLHICCFFCLALEIATLTHKFSSVTLYKNKTVRYAARMHAIIACQMEFQLYPMDIQICPIYIESCEYFPPDHHRR